jgi:predicted ester cyclase
MRKVGKAAMTNDSETKVRRIIGEVVDGGDYSLVAELISEQYVDHTPMGDITGHEAFRDFIEQFRAAMPGFRHELSDIRSIGNGYVSFLVKFSGEFTGEFMGVRGDGRRIALSVANAARFVDGKLVEHWGLGPDTGADIMSQMGVQPAPA